MCNGYHRFCQLFGHILVIREAGLEGWHQGKRLGIQAQPGARGLTRLQGPEPLRQVGEGEYRCAVKSESVPGAQPQRPGFL